MDKSRCLVFWLTVYIVFEKNSGTSKIRVLPSGTSPQTMDLENFASGKSILLTTKLVDGRACGSHLQCSARRGWTHIVYYTSVDCNPLTPITSLCSGFVAQVCSSWQDFDWHTMSRGPSAVAELLVFILGTSRYRSGITLAIAMKSKTNFST